MIVNITTTNVQVIPELNAVNLTITPTLISGAGGSDVTKAYVDQKDSLKVDKVLGKELSTNDFTDELNANLTDAYDHSQEIGNPHQTSFENIQGYPTIPTGKALFDDKTFKEIAQAGGASSQPLYMTNANSDIAGYKTLSYAQESAELTKSIIANNNNTVSGEAYLSPLTLDTALIPAGTFDFGYWRSVSSASLESYMQIEVFVRNPDGSEQSLITFESASIEETVLTEKIISRTSANSYNVNPLGRFGVRVKFRTTRTANTTLNYLIGDGLGLWLKNPLSTRHDLLRDKNGNLAYQHLDASIEKANPIDADSVGVWDSVAGKFVLTTIAHLKTFLKNYFDVFYLRTSYAFACSDETTDITASTTAPKILYRFAEPFVMDGIIGGLGSASVTGLFTIIVKKNGVSVFSTNLTIDSGEVTTTTALTPYVFTAPTISFAIDDSVEIFVTNVGATSAGKGLKITLLGHK